MIYKYIDTSETWIAVGSYCNLCG